MEVSYAAIPMVFAIRAETVCDVSPI